jgi:hypothetical protein
LFSLNGNNHMSHQSLILKGLKLEIFGSGVLTQIRPVWVGDLGTRPKIQNFDGLGGLGLKSAIDTF